MISSLVLLFSYSIAFSQLGGEATNPNIQVVQKPSVGLMDNTNPDNLAACLAKINFTVDTSQRGKSAEVANNQVMDCVKLSDKFAQPPNWSECRRAAQNIKSNANLKEEILDTCTEKYYKSHFCVRESKDILEKITKAKAAGKDSIQDVDAAGGKISIADLEKRHDSKVRDCVLKNSRYFDNDFCIVFIKENGMLSDKELSNVCLNKTKKADKKDSGDSQN